jgi:protein subunit release factor B
LLKHYLPLLFLIILKAGISSMSAKDDLFVQEEVVIPSHELEITTSRSGGPGGQHVNKTDTRVTIRWNINNTSALDPKSARFAKFKG